jgi:hypothetical protein
LLVYFGGRKRRRSRCYTIFIEVEAGSKGMFGTTLYEGLLCFLLKNGFFEKTFGRAPLEELEPEPERSPTKRALKRT